MEYFIENTMKKSPKYETIDDALAMLCRQYEKDGVDLKSFLEKEDGLKGVDALRDWLDTSALLNLDSPGLRAEIIEQARQLINERLESQD